MAGSSDTRRDPRLLLYSSICIMARTCSSLKLISCASEACCCTSLISWVSSWFRISIPHAQRTTLPIISSFSAEQRQTGLTALSHSGLAPSLQPACSLQIMFRWVELEAT